MRKNILCTENCMSDDHCIGAGQLVGNRFTTSNNVCHLINFTNSVCERQLTGRSYWNIYVYSLYQSYKQKCLQWLLFFYFYGGGGKFFLIYFYGLLFLFFFLLFYTNTEQDPWVQTIILKKYSSHLLVTDKSAFKLRGKISKKSLSIYK